MFEYTARAVSRSPHSLRIDLHPKRKGQIRICVSGNTRSEMKRTLAGRKTEQFSPGPANQTKYG